MEAVIRALVTGGSRGIGAAICEALKADGVDVFTFSRTGGHFPADGILRGHRTRVWEVCGPVDILVNCLGGGGRWGPENAEEAEGLVWEEVWQKNAQAAADFTTWALPAMMERGFGRVVTISSIYGREAGGRPWFAAAKAAQIAMMKAYSQDPRFARRGITFNTVCPGFVEVPGKPSHPDPESLPMGRPGTPQEVANVVAFLCSEKAAWISGSCLTIDGGESRGF